MMHAWRCLLDDWTRTILHYINKCWPQCVAADDETVSFCQLHKSFLISHNKTRPSVYLPVILIF